MRAGMPRSSAVHEHLPAPPVLKYAADQSEIWTEEGPLVAKPGGLVQGPRHVGLRRWAGVDKNTPIGEDTGSEG